MTNLALIGVGNFGSRYIKTIKSLPGVRLKYISTSSKKKREQYEKQYTVVSHYTKLATYKDIDGIIVATPASTHYVIGSYFLKKGFNVLIEKPLATSLPDARKLLTLWVKAKSIGMVGHIYLFNPAFNTILELLPKIGKIKKLEFIGGNWGPIRPDVSVLWDYSPHDIAMCLAIIRSNPVTVEAFGQNFTKSGIENLDEVVMRLLFPHGIIATIHSSRIFPEKIRKLTIVGVNGSILFDDTQKKKKIVLYPLRGINNISKSENLKITPKFRLITPLAEEINLFVRSIQNKKEVFSDIRMGYEVVKIISTAERSHIKKKPVHFGKNL